MLSHCLKWLALTAKKVILDCVVKVICGAPWISKVQSVKLPSTFNISHSKALLWFLLVAMVEIDCHGWSEFFFTVRWSACFVLFSRWKTLVMMKMTMMKEVMTKILMMIRIILNTKMIRKVQKRRNQVLNMYRKNSLTCNLLGQF